MTKLMNFSQALEAIKQGLPVCRQCNPDLVIGLLPERKDDSEPTLVVWERGNVESMMEVVRVDVGEILGDDWGIAVMQDPEPDSEQVEMEVECPTHEEVNDVIHG